MTSILPGQIDPPDYTDGKPFWKWFFEQTSNKMITGFAIFAIIFLAVTWWQFDSISEFIWFEIGAVCWWLLNLVLSYRSYKQLQKGISR